ncbi:hypothetical protein B0F90DRAFT_614868 [Multifurca ochricompacta]|uniref:Uncharacterized protein n=1 Tax=Multifurca ochricompacta TaxID=376703 RepID=A0AAD4QMS3_9AGAM|nr:hypothetical protein B0F90DRAFT_614868 [Multifurca ochricompacta]
MVTTSSIAVDNESKRQRLTLEKTKVVNLSKQLQIRLQYARLKVEHGWQRQSLNEVENLYFHHSTLKGKSKASVSTSSTASSSSSRGSGPSQMAVVKAFPEAKQTAPPTSVTSPLPAVVVSSSPSLSSGTPHSQSSNSNSPPLTAESTPTPSVTPTSAQPMDPAQLVTHTPSVLSAFSQNYSVTQQLPRATTMDFSALSPFVTSSYPGSSSSFTAPSSFVSPGPSVLSQTLAYPPSPFAPPPSSSVPCPPLHL